MCGVDNDAISLGITKSISEDGLAHGPGVNKKELDEVLSQEGVVPNRGAPGRAGEARTRHRRGQTRKGVGGCAADDVLQASAEC